MHRCLLCGRDLSRTSFRDALYSDDPLCSSCRSAWVKKTLKMRFCGVPLESPYLYSDAFSAALIQYKECGDEALKDIFLYPFRDRIRFRYRGYTLVPMPSTQAKREERGFDHVRCMFACTGLPVQDLFVRQGQGDQKKRTRTQRSLVLEEIALMPDMQIPDKVLLIDDTVTTGSTLKAALALLADKGVKLRIYTVSANRRWYKLPFAKRNDIIE
ncbi:MAG: hypothetical protein K6G61_06720 [Solobacterium sp.]|nr:hypothetical protein [Solobacterium sp.]